MNYLVAELRGQLAARHADSRRSYTMNKKFIREVLRLLPTFAVAGRNFFYERPFQQILAGFAWETPRGRLYIWKYAFPIFEDFPGIHLSYGSRLPRPADSMPLERGNEVEMAAEFVRRIEPYREEISKLRDLGCFLEYIQSREAALDNPVIRRGYALTLIMAGRSGEAEEQLKYIAETTRGHELEESAKRWIADIHEGVARGKLLFNEQQFMSRMEIQGQVP